MKKRAKKLLSFTLSMLIVLSCFSTGLVAFAAEKDAAELAAELTTELTTTPVPETETSVEDTTQAPETTPEEKPGVTPVKPAKPSKDEVNKQLEETFENVSQALSAALASGMQALPEVSNALNAPRDKASLDKFLAAMDQVTEPYDNNDIALVKPLYNALSFIDKGKIPKDVKAKYQAILASIGPNIPTEIQPDLSVYHKAVISYPKNVSREKLERALPKLEGFVNSTLLAVNQNQDLSTVINSKLYTNATVLKLCQTIFPAIGDLIKILKFPPTSLASSLQEEKFAGAVKALKAAGSDWNAVVIANGDFGFQDGDKEGFLDAASAIFRPLSLITLFLPFENKIDTKNGTYTYGIYEDFIPVFEMLDAEGVLSSHEYTLQVQKIAKENPNAAMDARIRPILEPLFNLVDRFAEKPVNTVLNVLPKLAYLIDSGLLNTQLNKILSRLHKLVPDLKVDLSTQGLYAMLAPALKEIDANGIKLSFLQNEEAFTKFITEIGGCAVAKSKDSIAFDNIYRLGLDADPCNSFVVLFRFLYNEITAPANISSLRDAVATNQDLSKVERFAAEQILNQLERTSADKALSIFVNIVAPNPPKFTVLGMLQDILAKLFGKVEEAAGGIGDILANIFGGKDSNDEAITDNPDIPKTGRKQAGAMIVFALTAAAASGVMIYKKRKEDE